MTQEDRRLARMRLIARRMREVEEKFENEAGTVVVDQIITTYRLCLASIVNLYDSNIRAAALFEEIDKFK